MEAPCENGGQFLQTIGLMADDRTDYRRLPFAVAAEEVRGPARLGDADPLLDPLGDVTADQVRREFAGRGDGASGGRAVRDHDGAAHAEQGRAAVALRLQAVVQLAQATALQGRAEARGAGAG